jgi:hypothetical protein
MEPAEGMTNLQIGKTDLARLMVHDCLASARDCARR